MSEQGSGAGGLEGRAALVTGGSSGLGRAVAIALAEAGADVALIARSQKDLQETVERVSHAARRALALPPTDLASATETQAAVERTIIIAAIMVGSAVVAFVVRPPTRGSEATALQAEEARA